MGQVNFDSLGKVMQKELEKDQHPLRTRIGTAKFASELCETSGHLGELVTNAMHSRIYELIQERKNGAAIKDVFLGLSSDMTLKLEHLRIEPQDLFKNYNEKYQDIKDKINLSFTAGDPWLKEGKKASTVLKEILTSTFDSLDKKNVAKVSEVMSSKAKECYSPDGSYVGYFGQGKFVGEGIWETEGTCTRIKDKENPQQYSSGWTDVQNRVFPLVARSIKTPTQQKGRVIVAFGGNGFVRFWNNYYVGQKISLENFVKIFGAMYNVKMIKEKPKAEIGSSMFINYAKDLIYQNPSQGWWRIKERPARKTYFVPKKIRCASCRQYVNKLCVTGKDRHKFICEDCSGSECPMCTKPSTTKLIVLTEEHAKALRHKSICQTCHDEHIGNCLYCETGTTEKFWFLIKKKAVSRSCCKDCATRILEYGDRKKDTLAYECHECGVFVDPKNMSNYNKANSMCVECIKDLGK